MGRRGIRSIGRWAAGASVSLPDRVVGGCLLFVAVVISRACGALPSRARRFLTEALWMGVLGWRVALVWVPEMRRKGFANPAGSIADRPPGPAFRETLAWPELLEENAAVSA
jgi:hypothetical protein